MNNEEIKYQYLVSQFEKKRDKALETQRKINELKRDLGIFKDQEKHYLSLIEEITNEQSKTTGK